MLIDSECPASSIVLDHTAMLDRVGGDMGLLREITAIFLSEYPTLLAEIRMGIIAGDARRVERAAHSLKGAVSNFAAHTVTQAAYQLEVLGRNARLEDAPAALATLESQLAALQPALSELS
jgi:HPt (histidine-containing phosphotransfer) domain-containing protein